MEKRKCIQVKMVQKRTWIKVLAMYRDEFYTGIWAEWLNKKLSPNKIRAITESIIRDNMSKAAARKIREVLDRGE